MNASETIVLLLLLLLLFGKDVCRIRHGLRRTFSSLFRKLRMKRRIWIERDRGGDSCGGICLYFRVNNNTNFYKLDKKPRPILPPNYLLRAKSLTKEHLDRRLKFFVSRTFSKRSQAVTVLLWFSLPGLLPFVTLLFRGGRRIPLYYCPPRFLA